MRIAIVHKEKCKPNACGKVCAKVCPINKKGEKCIEILDGEKAKIDEKLCVGCGICPNRCPFGAIDIINLPSVKESDLIFRYGTNGFSLYGLPIPKEKAVLGFLGRNGIGKTTAIEILTGKLKVNLGKNIPDNDKKENQEAREKLEKKIKEKFQGTELMHYFNELKNKKISYKPQNLFSLVSDVKVIDLLEKLGKKEKIKELVEKIGIKNILENKLNKISGGELQKVAILACCLKEADIYFFDEPLAFLDIGERIRISDFIKELARGKTVIVIEHDLLILDYLTEYINIFFGQQACYGLVSGIKSTKYGINSYLEGFLKEENVRMRDKALNFNLIKAASLTGSLVGEWEEFEKKYTNFSFKANKGEIRENCVIGILGKNGTGKTTFMKALAGIEPVHIEKNKKEKILDLKLKVSYKPQYIEKEDKLVSQIIKEEKINKKICSTFNIENIIMKKISELSGGELQRFSIARCLSKEADLYLLDEPSAYLDVEERINLAKAIKEIMNEKQKTAFVIDHDLLLISYVADNILVFQGESGKHGISSELLNLEKGISLLLKELNITLRKDKESGRPKINDKDSVLDREQKAKGEYAVF
jgi:ATP-binding cassette subfamily E protein 1